MLLGKLKDVNRRYIVLPGSASQRIFRYGEELDRDKPLSAGRARAGGAQAFISSSHHSHCLALKLFSTRVALEVVCDADGKAARREGVVMEEVGPVLVLIVGADYDV